MDDLWWGLQSIILWEPVYGAGKIEISTALDMLASLITRVWGNIHEKESWRMVRKWGYSRGCLTQKMSERHGKLYRSTGVPWNKYFNVETRQEHMHITNMSNAILCPMPLSNMKVNWKIICMKTHRKVFKMLNKLLINLVINCLIKHQLSMAYVQELLL